MLFASDLDNTLIYSYKFAKAGDICVETKNGKELSFMTRESYAMLKDVVTKCVFVPVTTRSLEQYLRIDLGVKPKYAIVAHGALLINDGKIDDQWTAETRRLLNVELPKINEINANELIYDIRYVEDFFIFTKSKYPQQAVDFLQTIVDEKQLKVCAVHNKVYILPLRLDKGAAVKRLKKFLQIQSVICAGDSELDIPMLEIADDAIFPQTLKLRRENSHILDDESFTSEILNVAMGLM